MSTYTADTELLPEGYTAAHLEIAWEAINVHGAWQLAGELAWTLQWITPGATVLEIGSHMGGTLYAWKAAGAGRMISVDLNIPRDSAGNVALHGAEFVQGNSQEEATRNKVVALLGDKRADFVFIDCDHSLEGVTKDWELYGPLGVVVGFHDINQHDPWPHCQVKQLWDRLRENRIAERVDDVPTGWGGVGIIAGP